jgi:hypothetical protein
MNLFINAALLGFIPKSVKKGLMAVAPVRRVRAAVMKDLGLPEDILTFVNYPTRFDCRDTQAAAQGLRHRMPQPEGLRLAPVGLLGTPPRPRPAHRPLPARHGGRQGGAGHRRLLRHWPGGGAQVRRGRCHHHHLRPRPGQARRSLQGSQGARLCEFVAYGRHRRHGRLRPLHAAAGREPRWRGFPDQQRRPLHPPRHRVQLRPLPRLRAHDAAQLLRLPARDHGAAARHGGKAQGPCGEHQLHRRADQRAAFFRLRGLQGGAGRVDALRLQRVRRPGHHLHHHQHAAGAHADDRAHEHLQQRAHAGARRGRRHDRRGLHLQAGAHRHPAGHHRPAAACAAAPRGPDCHEHQLPDVPGLVGRQGRQGRQAAAVTRSDRDAADDALASSY